MDRDRKFRTAAIAIGITAVILNIAAIIMQVRIMRESEAIYNTLEIQSPEYPEPDTVVFYPDTLIDAWR